MRKDSEAYTGGDCAVKDCPRKAPTGHFFCTIHWFQVSPANRKTIMSAFRTELTRAMREKTKSEYHAYLQFARAYDKPVSFSTWRNDENFQPLPLRLSKGAWTPSVKKAVNLIKKQEKGEV